MSNTFGELCSTLHGPVRYQLNWQVRWKEKNLYSDLYIHSSLLSLPLFCFKLDIKGIVRRDIAFQRGNKELYTTLLLSLAIKSIEAQMQGNLNATDFELGGWCLGSRRQLFVLKLKVAMVSFVWWPPRRRCPLSRPPPPIPAAPDLRSDAQIYNPTN